MKDIEVKIKKPDILTDQIHSAPEPLRNYIYRLETDADPSGNIRRAIWQEIENVALLVKIKELQLELQNKNEEANRQG
jgi:hypothetical protein